MKPKEKGIRPEKKSMVAELEGHVSDALYMIIADYAGMDMPTTTALKNLLRENGVRFCVVKNRMLGRAINVGAADLLKGQTAMIYGEGDVVEAAKVVQKFTTRNAKPTIRGGFAEGRRMNGEEFVQLAQIPPKDGLCAMLLGVLKAPCGQLAGLLHQKVASLVYVLEEARKSKRF